jgi:hypothetical protein
LRAALMRSASCASARALANAHANTARMPKMHECFREHVTSIPLPSNHAVKPATTSAATDDAVWILESGTLYTKPPRQGRLVLWRRWVLQRGVGHCCIFLHYRRIDAISSWHDRVAV